MTTPFDLLAEHYGPNGKGSLQFGAETPYGRPFILDTDNPFFKALWELCPRLRLPNTPVHLHSWDDDGSCIYDRTEHKGVAAKECSYKGCCSGTGYVRRSREEAALLLPDAIFESGYGVEMSRGPHSTGHLWCGYVGWVMREADNWLDALSAAILAKEGVKADALLPKEGM